jgi:putative transposase
VYLVGVEPCELVLRAGGREPGKSRADAVDWFSRFVLSWALSLTMELEFCLEALRAALRRGRPEIFNSDQGSQFASERFLGELEGRNIAINMDGRGRCLDNIFIERLWRSLKYEEVYLRDYQFVSEARTGIEKYFQFYKCVSYCPTSLCG